MHGLDLELAVLEQLRRRSPVPTPSYDYVDPAGRFAGYPFIPGTALTPARFAALAGDERDRVLQTAARFLAELHGLTAGAIAPLADWPSAWTPADYARRGPTEHLPRMAARMPAQADLIEQFHETYRGITPPRRVVIHGDLVAEHVLLDERSGRLSGIIDFGDVALGDPAQNFLGFWAYGADAVARIVEYYRPATADPGLLVRSRRHFICHRLDHIPERRDHRIVAIATEIDALLST